MNVDVQYLHIIRVGVAVPTNNMGAWQLYLVRHSWLYELCDPAVGAGMLAPLQSDQSGHHGKYITLCFVCGAMLSGNCLATVC